MRDECINVCKAQWILEDNAFIRNQVLTKFVPAVAVRRTVQALFGFIGCKGYVGCRLNKKRNARVITLEVVFYDYVALS